MAWPMPTMSRNCAIARYAEAAIIEKLNVAGFDAETAPVNIGHNQARRTYHARPR